MFPHKYKLHKSAAPIITASLAIILLPASVCAAPQAEAEAKKIPQNSLSDLEIKLFGRAFRHNQDAMRLVRLEKLVFGSPEPGIPDARISRIWAVLNDARSRVALEDPVFKKERAVLVVPDLKAADPQIGGFTYPRITALERLILGQTYVDEVVADRLARLEQKTLPAPPSALPGLSERVESLESKVHVDNVYLLMDDPELMSLEAFSRDADRALRKANPKAGSGASALTLEGWISLLERQTIGTVYKNEPILQRIAALEVKVFGSSQVEVGLMERVQRLCLKLCPTTNMPANETAQSDEPQGKAPEIVAQKPGESTSKPQTFSVGKSSRKRSVFHGLGKVLGAVLTSSNMLYSGDTACLY